jgi:NitT/TauT family transport system substrate-binding protein
MPHHRRAAFVHRIISAAALSVVLLQPLSARASDVVVSNWGTNLFGVPYAVGIEKGYFKELGAPVTGAIGGGGGGSVVRALLANDLPFGEIASSAAMDAQRGGLPLVIVAGTSRSFDNAWMTLPSSPIHGIKDLVGKRVAFTSPQSITEAFLLMVLNRNGIDPGSVTRVATGGYGQGLTLLENGGVDVAPVAEPLKSTKRGRYREVFNAEEALPPILSVVAVTTRDYAAQHADKLRAILAGRRRGVEFIYQHPDDAARIMATAYDMDPKLAAETIHAAVKTKQNMWSGGELDIAELIALQKGMLLTGANVGSVDWQKLIDLSFLPDDLKAKSRLTAN